MDSLKNCSKIIFAFFTIIVFLAPITCSAFPVFECISYASQCSIDIWEIATFLLSLASVILLYFTFKEQRDFNKVQRASNDYEILTKLRTDISTLNKNISISIIDSTGTTTSYQGMPYIEELRKSTHPNNSIQEKDFDYLYKSVVEIAELCFLYHGILKESSLYNSSKISFFNAITIHLENARKLFSLYQEKNINITLASNDIWKRYGKNKKLLTKIDIIHNEQF